MTIHEKVLEHVVPWPIGVGPLIHIINRWVWCEVIIPLLREMVAVVARPGIGSGLHRMASQIPRDNIGRFDGHGRILPSDERTERVSARSGNGSDVGKCGPSGWHC